MAAQPLDQIDQLSLARSHAISATSAVTLQAERCMGFEHTSDFADVFSFLLALRHLRMVTRWTIKLTDSGRVQSALDTLDSVAPDARHMCDALQHVGNYASGSGFEQERGDNRRYSWLSTHGVINEAGDGLLPGVMKIRLGDLEVLLNSTAEAARDLGRVVKEDLEEALAQSGDPYFTISG